MPKYSVTVKFIGTTSYIVESETKAKAAIDAMHRFINEDLQNDTLSQFVSECSVGNTEEL